MDPNGAELPAGWTLTTKIDKDGTTESFYENPATKQKYDTKKDLDRYLNYQVNIAPHLDEFRECYGSYANGIAIYVERPWETDQIHDINDYICGRVGKVKEKRESSRFTSDISELKKTSYNNGVGGSMLQVEGNKEATIEAKRKASNDEQAMVTKKRRNPYTQVDNFVSWV